MIRFRLIRGGYVLPPTCYEIVESILDIIWPFDQTVCPAKGWAVSNEYHKHKYRLDDTFVNNKD